MLSCAHEQKAHGGAVDRHGQQKRNVCDAGGPYQTIRSTCCVYNEVSFSTDLCLQVAQMPKSRDLAIFMLTDRRTKPIALPLAAHACRINMLLRMYCVYTPV